MTAAVHTPPASHPDGCWCPPCLVSAVADEVERRFAGRRVELRREEVWTKQETAEFLRCSVSKVEQLAASGELAAIRIGSTWRCTRSAAEQFVRTRPAVGR